MQFGESRSCLRYSRRLADAATLVGLSVVMLVTASCADLLGVNVDLPIFDHDFVFEADFEFAQGDILVVADPSDIPVFPFAAGQNEPYDAYEMSGINSRRWSLNFETSGSADEPEWEELCLTHDMRFEAAADRRVLAVIPAGTCLANGGKTTVELSGDSL